MKRFIPLTTAGAVLLTASAFAQPGPPPGANGAGRPPGGGGGPNESPERELLDKFDANKNGRLETAERSKALEFVQQNPTSRRRGPRRGEQQELKIQAGKKISPSDIEKVKGEVYDPKLLRTLFIDFENDQWEKELEAFNNSDVDVPAKLTIDGKVYEGVGIHFRGASSYFRTRSGQKRSLNVSLDHSDKDQRLDGYKTLNLNNSFGDASLLGAVIYSQIARSLTPAPKVNLVRVVINGEYWGIYQNQQQFDKDFLKENYDTKKGARWKAPGSPRGDAGLKYLGEDLAEYKKRFEQKKGDAEDWQALIGLCKVLNETPIDQLEAALAPILDIESTLRFLAIDCTLMNSDGYWARASDFTLYRDPKGMFHIVPHDMNEAFRAGHRRRGESAADASPFSLDPLVGLDDDSKPLRSKLLKVPSLRKRYLAHCQSIARDWLDWKKLGPIVAEYRAMIKDDVIADTRKNGSTEAFLKLTADQPDELSEVRGAGTPIRTFADGRRAFLLSHPAIKGAAKE
ncbi:CotH kinase family protein [Verrucomicrobiaceae bacterium R5-34]|nr:CotH kinase family protein [Verrucomicrobiaceae bacterium R5-34]